VRKLLAVAAREMRERWILFPASLALGFNPLVLPAFGVDRQAMPVVGLVTSILLGAGAAVVMGSTMLARDVANGRLGFLFSRPVSWPAIWGGKWLAALVLVVSSGLLAAIPWMTAFPLASIGGHHGDSWIRAMLDGPGSAFCFTLIVLVVGLANFNATALRSRSPWVALDLVLLLAALWATRRYVAPLGLYGILGTGQWTVTLALLPLALGLLVGSVAQVAFGRTDVGRAHRAMSLAFWTVVGLTLAVAAGYWLWVRSAGPAGVAVHGVTRDPAGRWVYVEGTASRSGWYPHGYLIDTTSGRYVTRPEPDPERGPFGTGVLFSADGRFAALPKTDRDGRGAALALYDLTGETPRLTDVTLESSPPLTGGTLFALSPSAASVFMIHDSGGSLFELPSGRRIATTTIRPGWRPSAVRFLAEGATRAWLVPWSGSTGGERGRAEMQVVDLSVDGTSKALTFPIAGPLPPWGWRGAVVAVNPDAGGERIVTADAGLHLRDGATGALIATLAEGASSFPALFLADGRIVIGDGRITADEPGPPRVLARVFDRAGVPLREMRLDLSTGGLNLGPEVAPGRVAVSSIRAWFLPEDTLLVDVGTNAEIVLGNRQKLVACSSPTGPAFEGAQISCGQRAAPGAIERVRIDRETLEPRFKVIGSDLWSDDPGFPAATGVTGVCGSGIIEVIAEMYLAGILTQDGVVDGSLAARSPRVVANGRTFSYVLHQGAQTLSITQNDVRAIQLAKAALMAGIQLLMERLGVEKVDRIRLAGAFGAHIDVMYATVLGMIPDCDLTKVTSAGNAAGTGARIALLDSRSRETIENLVRRVEKIETAIEPRFQEHFVEAMSIPHKTAEYPNLRKVVELPAPKVLAQSSPDGRERRNRRK